MTRTAFLVRCDVDEVNRIRVEAQREHRTISNYVLRITLDAVATDTRMLSMLADRSPILLGRSSTQRGERKAILVRCDVAEAERIREAAKRRDIHINTFILQALKSSWNQQVALHVPAADSPLAAAHRR